jgi:hypothetical protein
VTCDYVDGTECKATTIRTWKCLQVWYLVDLLRSSVRVTFINPCARCFRGKNTLSSVAEQEVEYVLHGF